MNNFINPINNPEGKETLFIDMDGVLCNFSGFMSEKNEKLKEYYKKVESGIFVSEEEYIASRYLVGDVEADFPHLFRELKPIEGAIESFHKLCEHFDVYLLSTPSWENPNSYMDKRIWVDEHLQQNAHKKLILSHNKALFTGRALIDDRTLNGAAEFNGEHIHFGSEDFPDWCTIVDYLVGTDK